MKVTDFPLGDIPYEAMEKVLRYYKPGSLKHVSELGIREDFIPTNWEDDLKIGKVSELVFWYPDYRDKLYQHVIEGGVWETFLIHYHPRNVELFHYFFPSTVKKLNRLTFKSSRQNHLEEVKLSKGRML